MTNVTIFGSGNMGAAIESVLAAGGASVEPRVVEGAPRGGPVTLTLTFGDDFIPQVFDPQINDSGDIATALFTPQGWTIVARPAGGSSRRRPTDSRCLPSPR